MAEEKDILTIQEAAEYLRLGKRSVYKLAKAGKIPAKMVLNKWRFEREAGGSGSGPGVNDRRGKSPDE